MHGWLTMARGLLRVEDGNRYRSAPPGLARRAPPAGVGAQATGLDAALNRGCPGRDARRRQPMDAAWSGGRCRRLATAHRPWSPAEVDRGASGAPADAAGP